MSRNPPHSFTVRYCHQGVLHSTWLKVFAFWEIKQKWKRRSGDSGCQKKSVWCASSCHRCMDIRHRHSSPLSTERLALVCPFLKKINVPVRETSRVITADVRGGHWGGFSCSSGAIHKNGVPFISGRKENRTETSKKEANRADVSRSYWVNLMMFCHVGQKLWLIEAD